MSDPITTTATAAVEALSATGGPQGVYALLPHMNGGINAVTSVLLVLGVVLVKAGKTEAHKACMGLAFLLAIVFLASYLVLHFEVGATAFRGEGTIRTVYYGMLITHMLLAAAVPFLATRTIYLARKGRIAEHRKLAKITFPVWLYVSVTGVLVYMFLYHWFPARLGSG